MHMYSTPPRNGNRANGNHLDICLLSSQKNRNSLTWVLVAMTVCFTYPDDDDDDVYYYLGEP